MEIARPALLRAALFQWCLAYAAPNSISKMMMLNGTPSSQRMMGMVRRSEP